MAANYNDAMPAFRYLALAALVVWLGLTMAALGRELGNPFLERFNPLAAASGAVVLVSLFVIKFVGPPPRSFTVRAGLVLLMLAATIYASSVPDHATPALSATLIVGLVLLFWYSHE
jgi:hypothetical protein